MRAPLLRLWLPVAVYMGLLFLQSAMPGGPSQGPFPAWLADAPDWLQHGIAYAGLGLLTLRATAGGRWRGVTPAAVLTAWLIAVCYGMSDEWHQSFVPGRVPDVRDLAADAMGAAMAQSVVWAWSIIRPRS